MENIVWHYTKLGSLEKIFPPKGSKEYKEGKIRLRFTNIKFLNDLLEGLVLKKIFEDNRLEIAKSLPKDFPEKIKEIISNKPITDDMINLDDKYTFSASYLNDSFVFWNKEYAGLDGVAIGFEKEPYYQYDEEEEDSLFQDVIYVESSIKTELINNIILEHTFTQLLPNTEMSEDILPIIINNFSCLCKKKSWENEKETRIIRDKTSDTEIKFEGNSIKKYCYEYLDKNLVVSIMLGPKCDENQVKLVKEYLKENCYGDIPVEKSNAFNL